MASLALDANRYSLFTFLTLPCALPDQRVASVPWHGVVV